MKKFNIRFFLLFFLPMALFFFSGTNASDASLPQGKRVRVLTSFYPVYVITLNVVKGVPDVTVENLAPLVTGCLHDYALTTRDMKKISDADIFVANGAGMESFLENVIKNYPKLKVIRLDKGVALIEQKGEVNPHTWVSISNAIIQVGNLGKAMEELDPVHAELYRKNTSEYSAKLEALRLKMQEELAPYKSRQIITFHEAFPYFAQEFGFKIAAVVERNPGSEPSAKELADIVNLAKEQNIKALFSEPQYPLRAAEVIAKEAGAKVYALDPAVTGPDNPDAYIDIMESNLKVLKEAFKQE